ncbi:hypothetical protein ET475_09685 [Microbacterium protaetiae]|uniref:Uncharacterized protein n=1 Tax=Microbacterium protaetiae TaxID=2509458 RepID=A0A4P6EFP8_9MICO|nr:hypothetical protein [Microbacterium protaetiae]QAY60233.1 hypothetical protein ET475_09685 [Microbacterium protaetiae]
MSGAPGGSPRDTSGGPVRPVVAWAFATVLFVALMVGGLGVVSLTTGRDVIAVADFGELVGTAAAAFAAAAFAGVLWMLLRRPQPSLWGAVGTAASAFLVYLAAVWIGGTAHTGDVVLAASVAGSLVTGGFALVVAGAGLLAGWGGILLVRSSGGRPRWPWEGRDEP